MTSHLTTPWLTVCEASARLGLSKKTIYREVQAGRLRATRVGSRRAGLRFLTEWVDDFATSAAVVEDLQVARKAVRS